LVHDLIGDISKNNEALNKNTLDLDKVKNFFDKNQQKLNDIEKLVCLKSYLVEKFTLY
jgi:hypothetical protein